MEKYNPIVTVIQGAKGFVSPKYVLVDDVINQIKKCSIQKKIDALRQEKDSKKNRIMKTKLPAIMFSGKFKARGDENIEIHSGLCVMDFDHLANPNEKKTELSKLPFILVAFISPNGEGIKAVCRIPADITKHAGHYLALLKYFGQKEIDTTSKNLERLCFASADANIYYNPQATFFTEYIHEFKKAKPLGGVKKATHTNYSILNIAVNKIRMALDGKKHEELLRAAKLMGGYIASGLIEESEAQRVLENEISKKDIDDFKGAQKTIEDGIKHGKTEPIFLEERKKINITEAIKSHKVLQDDENFDFVADEISTLQYLESIRNCTFKMGLTTGIPELDEYFRFKEGNTVVINGHDNVGKALALNTQIPTPKGWITMKDIKKGDEVFDENGNICQVMATTEELLNRNCYEIIFNDGTKIIADENHQWVTDNQQSRNSRDNIKSKSAKRINPKQDQRHKKTFAKIRTTKEISESLYTTRRNGRKMKNHSIGFCQPLQLPERDLLLEPYLLGALLGAWLGDGNSDSGGFTSDDLELIKYLKRLGYEVSSCKTKQHYYIYGIVKKLRKLNVLKNKHIPIEYLRSSERQRIELLKGLMDTDGYANPKGTCEFCVIKKQLAEDVLELITSLGMKATITESDAKLYGRIISKRYRVVFKPFSPVFNLKRKLKRTNDRIKCKYRFVASCEKTESVPVRCIQVNSKSQLYLCTKSYIPTHNSTIIWYLAVLSAIHHNWNWIIFSAENKTGGIFRKLIEFKECQLIKEMSEDKYYETYNWAKEHFTILKNYDTYVYKDILAMATKLFNQKKYNAILIDPYNSLHRDKEKSQTVHDYDYEVMGDVRQWAEKYACSVYINCHVQTEALRRNYPMTHQKYGGMSMPPGKADTEGGGKFSNRADDFLTIHRMTQHAEDWMYNEIHVRKIRENETGGKQTIFDQPVKLKIVKGGVGFETASGFNPITPAEKFYSNKTIDFSQPLIEQYDF